MVKYQGLSVFLTLCGFFPLADGSVHIYANPKDIDLGLTPTLSVKCTFKDWASSDISYPMSLIVSFATNMSQTFTNLASVNAFSGPQVTQKNADGNPIATGYLNVKGDSFLTLVWNNPMTNQAGVYKCAITGLNNISKVVTKKDAVKVSSLAPDISFLVGEFVSFKHQFQNVTQQLQDSQKDVIVLKDELASSQAETDGLKRQLETLVQEVESLKVSTNTSGTKLSSVLDMQQQSKARMARAAAAFFEMSSVYFGRRYYLSKRGVDNGIYTAEGVCEIFGGYLAEIDDISEYRYVQNFVKSFSGFNSVYIGGTDEAQEGHFVFQHSKRSVIFTDWSSGQPSRTNKYGDEENCMVLWLDVGWTMNDRQCNDRPDSTRFLCEVPLI